MVMSGPVNVFEALIALGIILGTLVAIAATPLYPVAFGVVLIAGLYLMMEHPSGFPKLVSWASSKLQ